MCDVIDKIFFTALIARSMPVLDFGLVIFYTNNGINLYI